MTVIRLGRKGSDEYMEFSFPTEMSAYSFYADAIDSYREDDLRIEMEGAENEKVQNKEV